MSNRQARRQQSRQARRQATGQRGRSSGAPRQSGGGGGRGSNFLSRPYLIGVALLAAALFGVVIFLAVRDGGGGNGAANENVAALNDARADLAGIPRDGNVLGAADAPVTLVQYEDFQCPHCLRYTAEQEPFLVEEYVRPGLLRIEFRHFPVVGVESMTAARGSVCAAGQGRFWEYANRLFAIQADDGFRPDRGAFDEPALTELAGDLGLDGDAFTACLADPDTLSAVSADDAEARAVGFRGTPSFVLNGVPLQVAPGSEDTWRRHIDEAIAEATGEEVDADDAGDASAMTDAEAAGGNGGEPANEAAGGNAGDAAGSATGEADDAGADAAGGEDAEAADGSEAERRREAARANVAALDAALADLDGIPRAGNALGATDAPVTLVQYVDFQCPHCLRHAVEQEPFLVEEYVRPGLLRIEFRHFPVVGAESTTAARGSVCAAAQDRFWEYANRLFAIQAGEGFRRDGGAFGEPALTALAGELGLDEGAFAACLADPATLGAVEDDHATGRETGFQGTPAFVLNDAPLQQFTPGTEDSWRALIDAALADAVGDDGG